LAITALSFVFLQNLLTPSPLSIHSSPARINGKPTIYKAGWQHVRFLLAKRCTRATMVH
jgi:hypothetical protein